MRLYIACVAFVVMSVSASGRMSEGGLALSEESLARLRQLGRGRSLSGSDIRSGSTPAVSPSLDPAQVVYDLADIQVPSPSESGSYFPSGESSRFEVVIDGSRAVEEEAPARFASQEMSTRSLLRGTCLYMLRCGYFCSDSDR